MADVNETTEELDGSVDAAASAIEALLKQPSQPQPEEIQPKAGAEAPQPAAVETVTSKAAPAVTKEVPQTETPKPAEPPKMPDFAERDRIMADALRAKNSAEAASNQLIEKLNTLVPQLESVLLGEFADIKTSEDVVNLMKTDPDRYNRYYVAQYQIAEAKRAQAEARTKALSDMQSNLREWQQGEVKKLTEMIPELGDKEKGPALSQKILQYAQSFGYTQQQLQHASANDFRILYESMQFRAAEADKANQAKALKEAEKKAAVAPPVQQPGTPRNENTKEEKVIADYQRLQKSGRVDDAAALIRHML